MYEVHKIASSVACKQLDVYPSHKKTHTMRIPHLLLFAKYFFFTLENYLIGGF